MADLIINMVWMVLVQQATFFRSSLKVLKIDDLCTMTTSIGHNESLYQFTSDCYIYNSYHMLSCNWKKMTPSRKQGRGTMDRQEFQAN